MFYFLKCKSYIFMLLQMKYQNTALQELNKTQSFQKPPYLSTSANVQTYDLTVAKTFYKVLDFK